MQIIKKITIFFLSIGIICGGFTGCFLTVENAFDVNSISSYRDIPGITDEEIDAIEALKATRENFSFAGIISTELFPLADGTYAGFQVEFCELMSRLFDIPFVIETHGWTELKNGIDGMTIDFTGEMTPTTERLRTYHMSSPVTQRGLAIVTYGNDFNIETESDLEGLRIGFWEGTITAQSVLSAYPNLEFEIVPIAGEINEIEMLRSGMIDAHVMDTSYIYEEIESVSIMEAFPLVFTPVSLTTANDELKPIISAVDKYITSGGIKKLHELNLHGQYEYRKNKLWNLFTDEERAYMEGLDGKIPVVMETDNYPTSFYNKTEGEFQGISIDILKEISHLTGMEFEIINDKNATWTVILDMLRSGEAALISELLMTPERMEHYIWPKTPYFSSCYAFISKSDTPNYAMYQIPQASVGAVTGTAFDEMYHSWFPGSTNKIDVRSISEGFDMLEKGEIDLFLIPECSLLYQHNYREKPGYKVNLSLPIAVDSFFGLSKGQEVLCGIICKLMPYVGTDEISNDWVSRTYDFSRELAQSRFYLTLLIAAVLLLVLVIVTTIYLRSVRNRKADAEVEKRTKLMLDANPLCCEIWDSNFNVVDCNEATVRFFGVGSKEEIINGLFDFSPKYQPDGQRSYEKVILMNRKAIKEGIQIFEWQHILLDGTPVPVEVTLVPIKYENNDAVIAYTRDMREHVEMMAEIYEAEERLRLMLDTSPLCCQLWHRSLKTMDCNEAAVKLYGFENKQEYIDKFISVCSPKYQPDGQRSDEKAEALVNETFEDGYRTFEWTHQMPDGTPFPTEITLVRVSYKEDYIVAGYTRDLREHNKMMSEITRHSELINITNQVAFSLLAPIAEINFEKSLIDGLEMLGCYMDADRVQIWHNETRKGTLYYILKHEWLSDHDNKASLFPIGTTLKYSDTWRELFLSGGHINEYVSELEPEDRKLMESLGLMSTASIPLFSNDEFWGLLCVDDCLKARKFAEEDINMLKSVGLMIVNSIIRIEQSVQLNKANERLTAALEQATVASKAKGDFLSTMSHEMRTPMNAIIGMTSIAKKTIDTAQKNHALDKIEDASSHLLGVINDVLDMAKIEANMLELSPVEFSFERMLQKVLAVTNFRVDEKQQKLTVRVDKSIPRFLIGDDQRLAQVLTNLISNAVKFTTERGEINLDVSLNSETDGSCELRIEVADNGIGMSPVQMEKLFSPFEQADSGISRKYGGTGLGLVISKRIVELMGGSIHVESESGHGSRFIFTVNVLCSDRIGNANESTGSDNADSSSGGINFEGKKILVVEDIEINREILIALLDGMGLTIDCAENGKEALEMIEMAPDKYDIVFMDVQMPLMDGLEATRCIRALPGHQCQRLPIIAMTANVFKSDIEKCHAVGMDDHIGKPFDIDNMLEMLHKYLY